MTSAAVAPLSGSLAGRPSGSAGVARLHTAGAVRAVFATRCASGSEVATVHVRRRHDAEAARVTVVAGKTIGNAVARNRAKRRLRGAIGACGLPAGADYVVVARAPALSADAQRLRDAVRHCATAALARCP